MARRGRKRRSGRDATGPAASYRPRQPFRPQQDDREEAGEYVARGINCHQRKEYGEAIQFYDKAIGLDPTCLHAYSGKGAALVLTEKPAEALVYFERAAKLATVPNGDYVTVYTNLAAVMHLLGRLNESAACLDVVLDCLNKNKSDTATHETVASLFEALGEKAKAAACRRAGDNPSWRHHMEGMRLASEGRDAEAAACFDRAIRENPSFAEAHYSKGTTMRHLGRFNDALACFRQAAKANPDFAMAYSDIAAELNRMGRNDEALESVETALRKDPTLLVAVFGKGVILASAAQHREAIAYFDRAVRMEPDEADVYLNKGMSHRALGENQEALRCFNHALKLEPHDDDALQAKSEVEDALGIRGSESWWDTIHDKR